MHFSAAVLSASIMEDQQMHPIHPPQARIMRRWLIVCMACVAAMVWIGGVTRLTESGLSIVKWDLVSGTLPPLSHEAWQAEFDAYKTSPEYMKKNTHFDLEAFKGIFWLEYFHRLLGRITGMVFLLPLIYFAARRALPAPFLKRMLAISVLVGAQGAVGWIMVASGLVDQPRVSPIKLALHLTLAFSVFASLLMTYFRYFSQQRLPARPWLRGGARALLAIFIVQLILGAIVAGTDAGYSYNTYPLMDGRFIPNGLSLLSPAWLNHLENITMIQFQHRIGALILVNAVLVYGWYVAHTLPEGRPWAWHMIFAVTLQFVLGVATLLSVMALPLASAHQVVALFLLASILRFVHLTRKV